MASPGKRSRSVKSHMWTEDQKLLLLRILANWKITHPRQVFKWPEILMDFNAQSGLQLQKDVLQNKHNSMRLEYGQWKNLIRGETGLGIDPITGLVQAPVDWWERKIKENKEYKKYRISGVPREIEDLYAQVFDGSMATGENLMVPGMVPQPRSLATTFQSAQGDIEGIDETLGVGVGGGGIPFCSEGIQEDIDASPQGGPFPAQPNVLSPAEGNPSSPAQVGSASQAKRQKRFTSKQDIALHHISGLREQMAEYLTFAKQSCTPQGSVSYSTPSPSAVSLDDVVCELYHMVGDGKLTSGSELMAFGLSYVLDENQRNLFMKIRNDEDRVALLNLQLCLENKK